MAEHLLDAGHELHAFTLVGVPQFLTEKGAVTCKK